MSMPAERGLIARRVPSFDDTALDIGEHCAVVTADDLGRLAE